MLYYCERSGVDLMGLKPNLYEPIFLQCFDTVGWVICPAKTRFRLRYDLECVWWDVKPCSIESRNFLKDSSTLRDKAFFHNFAHISRKKMIKYLHELFTIKASLNKEVPLNLGSYADSDSKFRPDLPCGGLRSVTLSNVISYGKTTDFSVSSPVLQANLRCF